METSCRSIIPHPNLLEMLFIFKNKVSTVFQDVLGLHEIHHIAITRINANGEIMIFSSTPAMEFNLFKSNLWRFDGLYQATWFQQCKQAEWRTLYDNARYDELYYLKQLKHRYPLGYALAARMGNVFYIYSFASHRSCIKTRTLFVHKYDDFYKIGQYCTQNLITLFIYGDNFQLNSNSTGQIVYETSN